MQLKDTVSAEDVSLAEVIIIFPFDAFKNSLPMVLIITFYDD